MLLAETGMWTRNRLPFLCPAHRPQPTSLSSSLQRAGCAGPSPTDDFLARGTHTTAEELWGQLTADLGSCGGSKVDPEVKKAFL